MPLAAAGDRISAQEATAAGLVSRVVPQAQLMAEARKLAAKIAQHSAPVVAKAKEAVNVAFEASLTGAWGRGVVAGWVWWALGGDGLEAHSHSMRSVPAALDVPCWCDCRLRVPASCALPTRCPWPLVRIFVCRGPAIRARRVLELL